MMSLATVQHSPIETIMGAYDCLDTGHRFYHAPLDFAQLKHCALIDLYAMPRVGLRGADAADYLIGLGFCLPDRPNQLSVQADGTVVARLSATEYFLFGALQDRGQRVAAIEQQWQLETDVAHYLLPRQDSHTCIQLTGDCAPQLMAKLCGVDLATEQFKAGDVVQTSVARINAIIMNVSDNITRFNIFCDRAAALYMWDVVVDAMQEFNGQIMGIEALTI